MRIRSLLLSLALLTTDAQAGEVVADVVESSPGVTSLMVVLIGEIAPGDLDKIIDAIEGIPIERRKSDEFRVGLLSNGGDLQEAMSIGRFIRRSEGVTSVLPIGGCSSACVFILAGGVMRYPLGKVGIHRPYFNSTPNSDAGEKLREVLTISRAYFEEMNIPPSLADAMFSIPPEANHFLSRNELDFYRLNQSDFSYQEKQDLKMADNLGVPRKEYMQFKIELERECGKYRLDPVSMRSCVNQVDSRWFNKLQK